MIPFVGPPINTYVETYGDLFVWVRKQLCETTRQILVYSPAAIQVFLKIVTSRPRCLLVCERMAFAVSSIVFIKATRAPVGLRFPKLCPFVFSILLLYRS